MAAVGGSASFSVAVTGTAPFDYAWYWAGTNLVQSGTNSTLTLPNVTTNNAGAYTVVITNNYGSVTSQVAMLTVALPPAVAIQPASQTNLAGTGGQFQRHGERQPARSPTNGSSTALICPTTSSPPWRAMAPNTIRGTEGRPPTPVCSCPTVWSWMPPATCILRTPAISASAKCPPMA